MRFLQRIMSFSNTLFCNFITVVSVCLGVVMKINTTIKEVQHIIISGFVINCSVDSSPLLTIIFWHFCQERFAGLASGPCSNMGKEAHNMLGALICLFLSYHIPKNLQSPIYNMRSFFLIQTVVKASHLMAGFHNGLDEKKRWLAFTTVWMRKKDGWLSQRFG